MNCNVNFSGRMGKWEMGMGNGNDLRCVGVNFDF